MKDERRQHLKEIDVEIKGLKHLKRKVLEHDIAKCKSEVSSDHVVSRTVTGGERGEMLTKCLVCGKTWWGYD
jgi:hypothetical protein